MFRWVFGEGVLVKVFGRGSFLGNEFGPGRLGRLSSLL